MPITDWAPDVSDVGNILRARTKDTNGNELGTFTVSTRPTAEQAAGLIETAAGDVAGVVGSDLPAAAWDLARSVTSVGAAMLIELSYFPEQVATGRSPYTQLESLYSARLDRLRAVVIDEGGDVPDAPGGTSVPPSPVGDFPVLPGTTIIGRGTLW